MYARSNEVSSGFYLYLSLCQIGLLWGGGGGGACISNMQWHTCKQLIRSKTGYTITVEYVYYSTPSVPTKKWLVFESNTAACRSSKFVIEYHFFPEMLKHWYVLWLMVTKTHSFKHESLFFVGAEGGGLVRILYGRLEEL